MTNRILVILVAALLFGIATPTSNSQIRRFPMVIAESLFITNARGDIGIEFATDEDGRGSIRLMNSRGDAVVTLRAGAGDEGRLHLKNADGREAVQLGSDLSGAGVVYVLNPNGIVVMQAGSSDDRGIVQLFNPRDERLVLELVAPAGHPKE